MERGAATPCGITWHCTQSIGNDCTKTRIFFTRINSESDLTKGSRKNNRLRESISHTQSSVSIRPRLYECLRIIFTAFYISFIWKCQIFLKQDTICFKVITQSFWRCLFIHRIKLWSKRCICFVSLFYAET